MILELIPMPDPFEVEWLALLGYESAERAKLQCRRDNDRLTRWRRVRRERYLRVAKRVTNGQP